MAELEFYWGTMNSGKSTQLLQSVYDYRQIGKNVLVAKPSIDTKKQSYITSRLGDGAIDIQADYIIDIQDAGFYDYVKTKDEVAPIDAIFIDEAQFLPEHCVYDLVKIVGLLGITVKAYGLRSTFDGQGFEGSNLLFANATKVEQITTNTLCRLSDSVLPATANLRTVNGEPVFDGETVVIDNKDDVDYLPVHLSMWVKLKELKNNEGDRR